MAYLSKRFASRRGIYALLGVWGLVVIGGFAMLWRYTLTPGVAAGAEMAHWSADIDLPRQAGLPTLVMVVHPKCPCSRASLGELAVLATNCRKRVSIDVVFVEPDGLGGDVESTELWQTARQIPDVTVLPDPHGTLTRRLGAATSGQVFLFDAAGALQFRGGITDSRGHSGNNAGRSAIEAILLSQPNHITATPVFGCALLEDK